MQANFRLIAAARQACRTGEPTHVVWHMQSLVVVPSAPLAEPSGSAASHVATCTRVDRDTGDPLKLGARKNHILLKALGAGLLGAIAVRAPMPSEVQAPSGSSTCSHSETRFQAIVIRIDGRLFQEETDALHSTVPTPERVADNTSILHRRWRWNTYQHSNHGNDIVRIGRGFLCAYHRSRRYLACVPLLENPTVPTLSRPSCARGARTQGTILRMRRIRRRFR